MANQPKAGEMLVGAYLKLVEECEIVAYGQHSPIEGEQMEVDVIGIHPGGKREIIVCEVATHLRGLGYGSSRENGEKVESKFRNAESYVSQVFGSSESQRYQFWSPNVPPKSMEELEKASDQFEKQSGCELELVTNRRYSKKINNLRKVASSTYSQRNELAFRFLQILEHLKE
ncbi:hypothetical protein [Natranaeroarchaeum sulfidigenes]|nr:hypothetical protein [Natranaeroarchaeum sulfidigenes]